MCVCVCVIISLDKDRRSDQLKKKLETITEILMVYIKIGTIGFYHLNHYIIIFCSVLGTYSIRI